MKKSTYLFSLVLVLMLMMSMSGCGKDTAKTTEATSSEISKETAAETTIKEATNTGAMSDNLYDFTVKLNGVVYAFPCLYIEFAANGWEADFGTETLDPTIYNFANTKNGDATLNFEIINLGIDAIPYADGYVAGLTYGILEKDKGCTLELSKGITCGSSMDEVIAAYGEPTRTIEKEDITNLNYVRDTFSLYKFTINNETGLVENIEIENLVISETADIAIPAPGEVPAIVLSYNTPTEIGTDLLSFTLKYDDALYNLPAPMAEFVKNGWTVKAGAGKAVAAKGYLVGVTLSKDDQTLTTTVANYADAATTVENCFVTIVMFDEDRTKTTIELPGGITEKSTYDKMVAVYGEPDDVNEKAASYYIYTYGSNWEQVKIYFNTETNKIASIRVQHDSKTLGQ